MVGSAGEGSRPGMRRLLWAPRPGRLRLMENHARISYENKAKFYREVGLEMSGLLDANPIANLANAASLLFHQLPRLNWAGFYLFDGVELVLGPFQGRTACVRIPLSKGVCGAAARERRTQLVPDVHLFPGHIACDAASRSEIVVPLIKDGVLIGVMDLDSPEPDRFDDEDRAGLEAFAAVLLRPV